VLKKNFPKPFEQAKKNPSRIIETKNRGISTTANGAKNTALLGFQRNPSIRI